MATKPYHVLFICTGNSARSILAEALMNHFGRGEFKAWSAGSHPTGTVNPLALAELGALRMPTDGFRSKSWNEFARPDAPTLDFVVTVCDRAAAEVCPEWRGRPTTAHWGVPDPAVAEGSDAQKRLAFKDAATILSRRIQLMLSVPAHKLDAMSLQGEVRAIRKHSRGCWTPSTTLIRRRGRMSVAASWG